MRSSRAVGAGRAGGLPPAFACPIGPTGGIDRVQPDDNLPANFRSEKIRRVSMFDHPGILVGPRSGGPNDGYCADDQ